MVPVAAEGTDRVTGGGARGLRNVPSVSYVLNTKPLLGRVPWGACGSHLPAQLILEIDIGQDQEERGLNARNMFPFFSRRAQSHVRRIVNQARFEPVIASGLGEDVRFQWHDINSLSSAC